MARLMDLPATELYPLLRTLSEAGFDSRLADLGRKPPVARLMVRQLNDLFVYTENEAIEILGRTNVLTVHDGWNAFRIPSSSGLPDTFRYLRSTLVECAAANKDPLQARWRLVYAHQLSLLGLWQNTGIDLNVPYSFSPSNRWWRNKEYRDLATSETHARYWLVNFMPSFIGNRWHGQTKRIGQIQKCTRAYEGVVAQAVIGFSRIHGEFLLQDAGHWGPPYHNDSLGPDTTVSVEIAEDGGVAINHHSAQHGNNRLGVCIAREYDF